MIEQAEDNRKELWDKIGLEIGEHAMKEELTINDKYEDLGFYIVEEMEQNNLLQYLDTTISNEE